MGLAGLVTVPTSVVVIVRQGLGRVRHVGRIPATQRRFTPTHVGYRQSAVPVGQFLAQTRGLDRRRFGTATRVDAVLGHGG